MSKQLSRAIHDLTNTMQVILSAIEQEEFQLALRYTRKALRQLESIQELIGLLQVEIERKSR